MTVDKLMMVKDNLNKLTLKNILMTRTKQMTKRKKKKTANKSKYYYCSMYILLSNNGKRIVQKVQYTCANSHFMCRCNNYPLFLSYDMTYNSCISYGTI